MDNYFIYAYNILLFLTTAIALVYRDIFGKYPLRLFPYYLLYLSLVIFVGLTMMYTPIRYNIWWYNIMMNGEIFFFIYLYHNLIQNKTVKKSLIGLSGIYVVYFLVNFLILTENWNISQSFPYALGHNIIIFAIFWYLIEFFKTEKVMQMFQYLIVWISFGYLFFFIVNVPIEISSYYTNRVEYINKGFFKAITITKYSSGIVLFLFIITGILWTSRRSISS
jgi:hypothetical protein